MSNQRTPIFIVLFIFSLAGLWQFSDGVRSVAVIGLFASGALLGAAVTGFLTSRN